MRARDTISLSFVACLVVAGCYDEPTVVPVAAPSPPATVFIRVGATTEIAPSRGSMEVAPRDVERVRVYPGKDIGRATEVVGVLDFHTDADSEDKGFALLKARAAALGADAVIGAEFEHGEGGGPSHLSGMAVRFTDR